MFKTFHWTALSYFQQWETGQALPVTRKSLANPCTLHKECRAMRLKIIRCIKDLASTLHGSDLAPALFRGSFVNDCNGSKVRPCESEGVNWTINRQVCRLNRLGQSFQKCLWGTNGSDALFYSISSKQTISFYISIHYFPTTRLKGHSIFYLFCILLIFFLWGGSVA